MANSPIEDAMRAHTNLNIFQGIVALLEGGTIYGNTANASVKKIVDTCKAEARKQLRLMDKAVAKAEKGSK